MRDPSGLSVECVVPMEVKESLSSSWRILHVTIGVSTKLCKIMLQINSKPVTQSGAVAIWDKGLGLKERLR